MGKLGLFLIIHILFVISINCSTDISGGTTSTENGKVVGVVKDQVDSLVSNCEVILIPSNYNPTTDSRNLIYTDTTNLIGEYQFDPVKNGNYNLICKDSAMSIVIDLAVNNDSVHVEDQILKKVSTLKIKITGDMPFMNNAYFQGTPFVAQFDSTDSTLFFDSLPYGVMPELIIGNDNNEIIVKDSIEITNGQNQKIEIDTNSFIVDNRFVGSGFINTINASTQRKWVGLSEGGLYYSYSGWSNWSKTDTGASPWLEDSILKIEAVKTYDKDWALIKTLHGTLFFEAGTYWSVEEQLYPSMNEMLPESFLISKNGELILSYENRTIIGTIQLLGDTLKDFQWEYFLSGGYSHMAGISDSLYLVKNRSEIYYRIDDGNPSLFYNMNDSITDIALIDNNLFIGCESGFYKYHFESDSLITISEGLNISNVRSIIKDGSSTICAITGDQSILYYDDLSCLIYTPKIDSSTVFIDMTFDNIDQLWISAGKNGLYTIQPVK